MSSLVLNLPVVDEKVNGVVLYDGPSLFDGKRIVVIATGLDPNKSKNEKTGKMVQTWIMVAGTPPVEALDKGKDSSVCGSCKHRHFRSCYVNLGIGGPYQVYEAWKNNKYPTLDMSDPLAMLVFKDKHVRLGSYGDPACVPIDIWNTITHWCAGHTGYTHAWKRISTEYRKFCMASCDTLDEVNQAKARGWKPFYVRQPEDPIPDKFFTCPASKEDGYRLSCQECMVCSGGNYKVGKGVPTIVVHGPSWKRSFFLRGMKLMRNKKKYVGQFN